MFTLIIGEKSGLNVRSMRVVLLLFEKVSGLKVYFHKSMLTGWIYLILGWWRRHQWWIADVDLFLLSTWGCPLVVIWESWVFGNQLWTVLRLVCRHGIINFYLMVASDSTEVCPVLLAGLLSFLFQSPYSYNFFYRIYF